MILYDGSYYLYGFGLEAMEQSGDWYCFLADGPGSTMAIVDDAGAVQNSYTYDVYGEPTVTGSLANEFDFAGQQTDGDTGLQYLRARYMDPETGVFLSKEPLAAMPGWLGSHYSYASGNPATLVDPTGLCVFGLDCPDPDEIINAAGGTACKVAIGIDCPIQPTRALEWLCRKLGQCGSTRIDVSIDDIALIGEYLLVGNVKFDVMKRKGNRPINLKSDDPERDSWEIFANLAKRNGSTIQQDAGSRGRYFFKTKSGLTVSWRRGSDPNSTPTIHIQNPNGGETKLKFTKR